MLQAVYDFCGIWWIAHFCDGRVRGVIIVIEEFPVFHEVFLLCFSQGDALPWAEFPLRVSELLPGVGMITKGLLQHEFFIIQL